jgi:hypothetical protein
MAVQQLKKRGYMRCHPAAPGLAAAVVHASQVVHVRVGGNRLRVARYTGRCGYSAILDGPGGSASACGSDLPDGKDRVPSLCRAAPRI